MKKRNEKQSVADQIRCLYTSNLPNWRVPLKPKCQLQLRNILSVLRSLSPVKHMCHSDSEEMIVMRGLQDMNLSIKLVYEDEPLFLSLLNDLFPGSQLDEVGYPDLASDIETNVQAAQFISYPSWNLKLIHTIQLCEMRNKVWLYHWCIHK